MWRIGMRSSRGTSSDDEKNAQIENVTALHERFPERDAALAKLKETAKSGGNVFAELMEAVKTCSLGSISNALFDVGGAYRRSM
jgi:isobutyryl-CoA mutase